MRQGEGATDCGLRLALQKVADGGGAMEDPKQWREREEKWVFFLDFFGSNFPTNL